MLYRRLYRSSRSFSWFVFHCLRVIIATKTAMTVVAIADKTLTNNSMMPYQESTPSFAFVAKKARKNKGLHMSYIITHFHLIFWFKSIFISPPRSRIVMVDLMLTFLQLVHLLPHES